MTKTFQEEKLFEFLIFGHWKLFDICNLMFVISIIQGTSNKANPLRGRTKPAPQDPDLNNEREVIYEGAL